MLSVHYDNKSVALLLWHVKKEKGLRIYVGTLRFEDGEWVAENTAQGWRVPLDEELQQRIRAVADEEERRILRNADYGISLSAGDLPDEDTSEYIATGIKWTD